MLRSPTPSSPLSASNVRSPFTVKLSFIDMFPFERRVNKLSPTTFPVVASSVKSPSEDKVLSPVKLI